MLVAYFISKFEIRKVLPPKDKYTKYGHLLFLSLFPISQESRWGWHCCVICNTDYRLFFIFLFGGSAQTWPTFSHRGVFILSVPTQPGCLHSAMGLSASLVKVLATLKECVTLYCELFWCFQHFWRRMLSRHKKVVCIIWHSNRSFPYVSSSDCTLGYILIDAFRPHGGVVESDVLLPLHSTTTLQLHRAVRIYSTLYNNNTLSRGLVVMWLQSLFARCFEGSCLYAFPITTRSSGCCTQRCTFRGCRSVRKKKRRIWGGTFVPACCVQGLLHARKSKLCDTLVINDMHRTFPVLFGRSAEKRTLVEWRKVCEGHDATIERVV